MTTGLPIRILLILAVIAVVLVLAVILVAVCIIVAVVLRKKNSNPSPADPTEAAATEGTSDNIEKHPQ